MSRSYKHTPRAGDKKDKFFKRYANKKLRRNKLNHNLQNSSYKKNFPTWDICDYESVNKSFEQYVYNRKKYKTFTNIKDEKEAYNKMYIRK